MPRRQIKRGGPEPQAGTSKRRRSQEQNNNTCNDSTEDAPLDTSENLSQDTPENLSQDLALRNNNLFNSSKCGVLKWVTVKNFMCHDHLNFEFSPHINFVQGRNGSGKSAILTAVVVGLGGVTRITQRGNNIKDLVKHGKHTATIEVGIHNLGFGAFKPDLYGGTVIVERKIALTGSGGYKIKAENGTVVNIKKDELTRMTTHFNIQVENPVTILNQDMSRSFFNTTDPKQLFKLFLKATQLQQMQDNYDSLRLAIQNSLRIITFRKQCLPDLAKEVEEHRILYQYSLALRDKGVKLKNLRRELAWAKLIEHEQEKAKAEMALDDHFKMKEELKEKIETLQRTVDEDAELQANITKQLEEASAYFQEVGNQAREMDSKMRQINNTYREKHSQFSISEKNVLALSTEIAALKKAIAEDNKRAKEQWNEEQEELEKKIHKTQCEITKHLTSLKTEHTHCENLKHTMDAKNTDRTWLQVEHTSLNRRLNELEKELKALQSKNGSELTVYGQWVPQLLKKIDAAYAKGMFHKKPVGPLGAFIKVKDTRWAHIAEKVLGRKITSFCVHDRADQKVFERLMKEVKFNQGAAPIVTVARFRDTVHDVSKYECKSPDYQNLWSILDISDKVVANALIDQMQVESILLIPTSQEAGELLKDRSTVPRNCKSAFTLNMDQYYPDPNYRVYSGRGGYQAKFLQVSVEDKVREMMMGKEDNIERRQSLAKQLQEIKKEIKEIQENIKASDEKSQQYKKNLTTFRTTLAMLQDQATPPPPSTAQLECDVKLQEKKLETNTAKMEDFRKSVQEEKVKLDDISAAVKELKQKKKHAYEVVMKCKKTVEESTTKSVKLEIHAYKKKAKELKTMQKDLEKKLTEATLRLNTATKATKGYDIGERIEPERSVKELERQYTSLSARLDKERADCGDPITVTEKYLAAKKRYKQVADKLTTNTNFMKKLRESLEEREAKYARFRKWLAVLVKYFFKEHLSLQKLHGSIDIDIEKQILSIRVDRPGSSEEPPANNKKRKSGAHQELFMMSGGERSFSTVAFIIALWHAMVSPIRILDEFDVFMDVIARSRAMKMMISSANPDTQYIFLTPLSLDTRGLRNCQFFKMPDHTEEIE